MSAIDDLIRAGEELLADFDRTDALEFILDAKVFLSYGGATGEVGLFVDAQHSAKYRIKGGSRRPQLTDERIKRDVRTLVFALEGAKHSQRREERIAEAQAPKAEISATATASAASTSLSSACAQLDQVDGIDGDVRDELKALMEELDDAKSESLKKNIAKKLFDTAIDKAADALPALASFVAEAVKSALTG